MPGVLHDGVFDWWISDLELSRLDNVYQTKGWSCRLRYLRRAERDENCFTLPKFLSLREYAYMFSSISAPRATMRFPYLAGVMSRWSGPEAITAGSSFFVFLQSPFFSRS